MLSLKHFSCHCGSVKQNLSVDPSAHAILHLCHCNECRYSSGLLCTIYVKTSPPESLDGISCYRSRKDVTETKIYFCSTCGCHVFRSQRSGNDQEVWEVASGGLQDASEADEESQHISYSIEHAHVDQTRDGGCSIWLPLTNRKKTNAQEPEPVASSNQATIDDESPEPLVQAACVCGNVQFHITRPDASSYYPHSGFPDLTHAYNASEPDLIKNPADVKWWIHADGAKYLAGTCACRSCRLTSGFEIQTWAFIPRSNILWHVRGPDGAPTGESLPLDFDTVVGDLPGSYESSSGVMRNFCTMCGATVFWHDKWRPELIDVSVGLLRAAEGARAETWLHWCRDRVSFSEDADGTRFGVEAEKGKALMDSLERGLKMSRDSGD